MDTRRAVYIFNLMLFNPLYLNIKVKKFVFSSKLGLLKEHSITRHIPFEKKNNAIELKDVRCDSIFFLSPIFFNVRQQMLFETSEK